MQSMLTGSSSTISIRRMVRAKAGIQVMEARNAWAASSPSPAVSAENGTSITVAFRPSGSLSGSPLRLCRWAKPSARNRQPCAVR